MPRFFIKEPSDGYTLNDRIVLSGADAHHIARSLRMRRGDELTVCTQDGVEYDCVLSDLSPERVTLTVRGARRTFAEPEVRVSVFQALPKAAKLEWTIQKCVELGAAEIIPVLSARCVARPDAESAEKKGKRWNTIAEEAAKQSGRGIIPTVSDVISYPEALARMCKSDLYFVCYEDQTTPGADLSALLTASFGKASLHSARSAAFFIGPEGGISPEEAALARRSGIPLVSLGPRILRTETAPVCVMSCIMYASGGLSPRDALPETGTKEESGTDV